MKGRAIVRELAPWLAVAEGEREVERELARERAESLGRAGRELAEAVAAHEGAMRGRTVTADEQERLLTVVAECLWRLLVQRECAGARTDNLDAVVDAYDVPRAALRQLP